MTEPTAPKTQRNKGNEKESIRPISNGESMFQLYKSRKPKKAAKYSKLQPKAKKIAVVETIQEPNEETQKDLTELTEKDNRGLLKTTEDFKNLSEVTEILKDFENSKDKVYLTKTEKACLEEITKCTAKVRAPLDDRQMVFYTKDCEKFSTPADLKEAEEICTKELVKAAANMKETPSKVMATELNTLVSYLINLKSLIAKREMAWASNTENDYAQKAEIKRLKTEVENLRVICTKRQGEIKEKDQIITDKEQEVFRWQNIVQKLKKRLLVLEKNASRDDDSVTERMGDSTSPGKIKPLRLSLPVEGVRKTKLQLVEDAILAEARSRKGQALKRQQAKEMSGKDVRKNLGPAALMANALYNARNEGNFVNF